MGHYITVGDVEARTPARAPFGPNTKPSASHVELLILEAEANVQGDLTNAGYSATIWASTSPGAFAQVQAACAWCAAAAVENVAVTGGPNDRRDHYQAMCDRAREALAAGDLLGVDRSDGDGVMRHPAASQLFSRGMDL